jgi:glycosyltransferase involved in cell wall biosynthesis
LKVFLNLLAATAGGQLTRARAFLDRFNDFAPESQLVVIKAQTELPEYSSTDSRMVIDVQIGSGRLKAFSRMWWENFVMPGLICKHQADVYLTFSHYLPQFKSITVPSVVGVSNLAPFSLEAWNQESLFVKLKMFALRHTIISSARMATCVLALSKTCRNVLITNGISEDKIVVSPNGVDPYWGQIANQTVLLARSKIVRPYLLYVSHFHLYKNHDRLIDAYLQLSPSVRDGHQLVLVGKPYSMSCYKEVQLKIERLGLVYDVILIPGENSENLRELYQNARLFVFPSLIENSPNILLEAMMAGVPVATSNLSPMPEFCGDAAEYFDALNVSEMSHKIELLLSDESRLSDLSQLSRMQATGFTWEEFVLNVVNYCKSIHI